MHLIFFLLRVLNSSELTASGDNMIYFDNAATTFPKPDCVINSVNSAMKSSANPGRGGYSLSVKAGEDVFSARYEISELFSCKGENVIFTKNCTEALNIAIKGLVKKNDHILISSLEHNSVLRPIVNLKEKNLVGFDIVKILPDNPEATILNFLKKIKSNTRLIVCTHISNVFGTVLPVRDIAEIAKRKGIYFILDAAQSAGTLNIDMSEGLFDIVCSPGHKGLYGPMGTGIMCLSDNALPETAFEGGTGSFSMSYTQPDVLPDKYESGTLNYPGIKGLLSGIRFIKKQGGTQAIYNHEMHLTDILYNDLKNISGLTVYDNMFSSVRAPLLSVRVKNYPSETVASLLDNCGFAVRGGYQCSYLAHKNYKTEDLGTVRISPGYFNTKNQIKNLCFCLNKIAKQTFL